MLSKSRTTNKLEIKKNFTIMKINPHLIKKKNQKNKKTKKSKKKKKKKTLLKEVAGLQ